MGALLLIASCGPAGTGGSGIDANLLTREEIGEQGPSNAYNVIQALRPNWLQKRGQASFTQEGEIQVYLDGTGIGGIETLRGIHTDNVESIRFLDARQAMYRFGVGHEHGAILVATRG
jgi:hypothetical protein